MRPLKVSLAELVRRALPASLKAWVPVWTKARLRGLLGIEPWPDLAVRHPLFRSREYKLLRMRAAPFDVRKPYKAVLERGHQKSYLVARWLAEAGIRSVFHVGYANGRYLFYFSLLGITCGGTDLPSAETAWTEIPAGVLDAATLRRPLRVGLLRPHPVSRSHGVGRLRHGRHRPALLGGDVRDDSALAAGGVSVPK